MTTTGQKKSIKSFYWTWLALTVLGVALSIWAPGHFMPRSMSNDMHLSILTIVIFSVSAAPVAAGVYAATLYVLKNFRYRGEGVPPAGADFRGNNVMITSWLLISTVLTIFLLVWGLGALAVDNGSTGRNPLVVNVTGQQWVWSFQYAGTNVKTNELYLPLNREVEFRITSDDVTHGFWIPQMGVQVDANQGVITTIHTTPSVTGTFDVRCTQFCGLNHAFMVTQGHVLSQTDFNNWLTAQPARA